MTRKLKAVLFDFDGVLRDSRSVIWEAYHHAFRVHNLPAYSEQELLPYLHHHSFVHQQFASEIPVDAFVGSYKQKLEELWANMQLYDEAPELIRGLSERGYRLALVSSAVELEDLLAEAGLLHLFDALVGGDDVTNFKPHAEPVLVALERLGIEAQDAIMVGDMGPDIEAAKAAKLRATVGILHGFGTEQILVKAGADKIIASLTELGQAIQEIEHES
jgi:pyrophosphatase PpaX